MQNKSLPFASASAFLGAGLVIARDARKVARAWSRYHADMARHTSQARQALLRARTVNEVLEVHARLRRGTRQSFRETIVKIAETASQMATRRHDTMPKEASIES